jgi:hypothetical protein
MDKFTFESKSNFLKIKVIDNKISFKANNKKLNIPNANLDLTKPNEIKSYIRSISDILGPEVVVLEIYNLKFQPLEDMIDSYTKTIVLHPSFKKNYMPTFSNTFATDYFNSSNSLLDE